MTHDIRCNGSGPSAPADTPANWRPSTERPWRPIGADSPLYIYDTGQAWCCERFYHPQHQHDGYPSPEHHPTECRSYGGWWEGWFEDARAGLSGPRGYLSAYLAKPFLFGRPRFAVTELGDRLALEFMPQVPGYAEPFRCSIPAESIRNLAAHLSQTADVWDGWRPPRHVRQSLTDGRDG